jgi:hypothetical protein
LLSSKYFPIGLLLTIYLIIGLIIVVDYGESWDEQLRYQYATRSLGAYLGESQGLRGEKGAAYVMIAKLGSEALGAIFQNWLPIETWHFMHFLSFLAGLLFFYLICLRLLNKWAAFGAVILFSTHPLIWGHAFINPKDIPFMAFFLGSIALGLRMMDDFGAEAQVEVNTSTRMNLTLRSVIQRLGEEWHEQKQKNWILSAATIGIAILILLALIAFRVSIHQALAGLIRQAYSADPTTLLGSVFTSLVEEPGAIAVESYIRKGLILSDRLVILYALLAAGLCTLILVRTFPQSAQSSWRSCLKPFLAAILASATRPSLIGASILLGLSMSIRTLGPFAGFLIAITFLYRAGRKAWPALMAYAAIALLVTYLTWPNLWEAPLGNYLRSITEASDYPWEGKVLFNGAEYNVDQIPRSYLPMLLSLQFTEPVLILSLAGVGAAFRRWTRQPVDRPLIALSVLWLCLPLLGVVILQPAVYDNFRHFLFITPPIFICAGLGLQFIQDRTHRVSWKTFWLILAVLPGVYWLFALHPYQYVYYNSLAGGLTGAFRRYEMDYWTTSYREATRFINETAPEGARVLVWGPEHTVASYARPDLVIEKYRKENINSNASADFAIVSSRNNKDITLFPEAEVLWTTGRSRVIFTVVKQLNQADSSDP